MKFIFLTDTHIKGKNPYNRTGNFYQDVMEKIKETINIARDKKCDFIVHGGDLYDSPIVSLNMCDELVDMIENSKIKWYIVRGNHDEIGHNPLLSGGSILDHIFKRSQYIKHMDFLNDSYSSIEGIDYYHNIESSINNYGLYSRYPKNDNIYRIAIIHANIVPQSVIFSHVLINNLKTDFNLILTGHYHKQFGMCKKDNTTIIGIGSLSRLTVSKSDLENQPSIIYVDTELNHIESIQLKSIKPIEKCFNLESVKEDKMFEEKIDDFIYSLENTKIQSLNLLEMVQEIINKNSIESDVMNEILKRIKNVELERKE